MSSELVIFYVLAAGAVGFAIAMLLPPMGRNPIHSALSLIGSFFCLAALYAQLSAHLLAAMQVIVYAGAVMVLFTFVIMLLNLAPEEIQPPKVTTTKVLAGVLALFIFGKLATAIGLAAAGSVPVELTEAQGYGTLKVVGRMLYSTFMVPFELASVLLLVAAVGAVVLAKRSLHYVERPEPPPAGLNHLANGGDQGGQDDSHGDPGHH